MNDTDFFISPLQTIHFISIFNSVNILSDIFHHENMLTESDRLKPIPIVNSLCEYLHKNNDSDDAIALGKKLLNNTEFYGSRENETIHYEYVDAMFDHIITSIVFSQFGNTFGYLAAIVNATNNLTLPFVKRKILLDLSKQRYLNQDYTISQLSPLSIERLTEKLIFPLFPDRELKIIDVDYIYAQAGLMFARRAQISNNSFEEYIIISQSVEQGVRQGQLNVTALEIFQLPALLNYVHKRKQDTRIYVLINDPNFWKLVLNVLFDDLNAEEEKIAHLERRNPVYNFQKALYSYRNRSEYAEYILTRICPLANESEYRIEVDNYKSNHDDYYCKKDNFHMPDINELFSQQNSFIANLYSYVEGNMVEEALGTLEKIIKQPNVTVSRMEIYKKRRCGFRCEPFRIKIRNDTIIFEIRVKDKSMLYALIMGNNINLYSAEDISFMEKVGLPSDTKFIANKKPLKATYQTFKSLIINLVEPRRIEFYNFLQNYGYEATTKEKIVEFLKNFIPFHTCVETAKKETLVKAICACFMDSLILLPIIGQAWNTGLKFASATLKPLLANFQRSMLSFTAGQFVKVTLRTGIRNLAGESAYELSKLITRELFKDIGLSIIRVLDPGIEISYKLGKAGIRSIIKLFGIIGRKIPLSKVLSSLNKMKQPFVSEVGTFGDHKVFVNSISGNDGYGIRYINFGEKIVELRRIQGYRNEVPVILVSEPNRKQIYQMIDLKNGELKPKRWEVNANGILEIETLPLATRLKIIQIEGLSGRGLVANARMNMKKQMVQQREEIIKEWKKLIDEKLITDLLTNYVFDDEVHRLNVLNQVAADGKIPEWISCYKLTNVDDYQILRYSSHVEDTFLTEENAVNRIVKLYTHQNMYEISPSKMYKIYQDHQLNTVLNFEDFYAISHFMTDAKQIYFYERPSRWMIQNAFNRLSMRILDVQLYNAPRSFYKFERMKIDTVSEFKTGKRKLSDHLMVVDSHLPDIEMHVKNSVFNDGKINVMYEIILDNSYMAVDTQILLSLTDAPTIILPKIEFIIDYANFELIEDMPIYKIVMKNTYVSKSKWIATINKNIEHLNEKIRLYNNVLNDFDLNLLN